MLVHGAWHDAGASDPLREIVDCGGYRSVAVDLPSDNVDVDASGYARVIAHAVCELAPETPVVVGNSMSGIALPLVPALAPVCRIVFLAALVPAPGQRMADIQAQEDVLAARLIELVASAASVRFTRATLPDALANGLACADRRRQDDPGPAAVVHGRSIRARRGRPVSGARLAADLA